MLATVIVVVLIAVVLTTIAAPIILNLVIPRAVAETDAAERREPAGA